MTKKKTKYPPCPSCGTLDYDIDDATHTKGFCLVGCGAVFTIRNGKAKLKTDEVVGDPMIVPPGVPVGV